MGDEVNEGTPDVAKDVAFDPEGDIRSQADAKAYGEQLLRERKLRGDELDLRPFVRRGK